MENYPQLWRGYEIRFIINITKIGMNLKEINNVIIPHIIPVTLFHLLNLLVIAAHQIIKRTGSI
jgi:hypothetical protein